MRMDLFIIALGILAGYLIRSRSEQRPSLHSRMITAIALGAAILASAWLETTLWFHLYGLRLVGFVPVQNATVGFVIGIILGDQQAVARLRQKPPDWAEPKPKRSFLERFWQGVPDATQGVAIGVTAAALIALAVVPPTSWSQLGGRVREVGAGSFKLSLVAGGQQSVAEAIRSAAKTSQIPGVSQLTQTRFVKDRLDILLFLTSPPSIPSGDSPVSAVLPNPFDEAEKYIRASPEPALPAARADQQLNEPLLRTLFECTPAAVQSQRPAPCATEPGAIRYYENEFIDRFIPSLKQEMPQKPSVTMIARDRSTLWQLASKADRERETNLRKQLEEYAAGQEAFLSNMRPHVACLTQVTEVAGDRQLLEYNGFRIIEHLFGIAGTWMSAEKELTIALLKSPQALVKVRVPTVRLEFLQESLFSELDRFNTWAPLLAATRAGKYDNRKRLEMLSEACGFSSLVAVRQFPSVDNSFAPYIAIFTSHLLAAIGDNRAAVQLLINWLESLQEIEDALTEAQRVAYRSRIAWMRLRVLFESLAIQKLSEGTPDAVPAEVGLLQYMVFQLFRDVLSNLQSDAFYLSSPNQCRAAESRWLQNVVLSYLTTVKQYLDLMNSRPDLNQLDEADWQLVTSLKRANPDCFSDILTRPKDVASLRVQFANTIAATTLNWFSPDGTDRVGDKAAAEAGRNEARVRLREAIALFRREGIGQVGSRIGEQAVSSAQISELILGTQGQQLLGAAQRLAQRLDNPKTAD